MYYFGVQGKMEIWECIDVFKTIGVDNITLERGRPQKKNVSRTEPEILSLSWEKDPAKETEKELSMIYIGRKPEWYGVTEAKRRQLINEGEVITWVKCCREGVQN